MPRGQHPNSRAALEASRPKYPPAPEGNQRRRVSGAYSQVAGPYAKLLSQEFFSALAADSPLTDDPKFVADVALVSGEMERLADAKDWIDKNRADFGSQRVQTVVATEERLRRSVVNGLQRLRMAHSSREDELDTLIDELRRELVRQQVANGASTTVVIEHVQEVPDGG